ncbi:hydrogenase maturation nickel metallochaperone HypA [Deferribacter autotrophicus]|uniref:Hydrogenase maturation factor HypA n=1 Tax=Deferribacter autotrophicus TaxID=500465 RepID=A0A5A8F707_9BACT|nr:hydrogenase maturation nickel metallochaperone HypA [Deferribacter autotrophicus]KAA0258669.1 hydrogenase maturation nickel metallochaperone HypA [Deferribacter autotrophicus]
MHEASIAQNILDIVIDTALKNRATKVRKVFVKIGKLAAVDYNSLLFAYNALKEDTIAAESELLVEEVEIRGECQDCGWSDVYEDYFFSCKKCGSMNVKIISGEELNITEIEVD